MKTERTIALALAGGNALGAYAAGAYEALTARGYEPAILSGASIGAVTGALIAGNRAERRVARLREFWEQAGLTSAFGAAPETGRARELYNRMHALQSLTVGRPGLFRPRLPGLLSALPGMPPDLAVLDHSPLVSTLERLVDFDLLNEAVPPLLVGAVDMGTGEPVVFDSRRERLTPQHFLATTAFMPSYPPVCIDGRLFADPGLVSNLPLDALLDRPACDDMLCFAVDLFDARGEPPRSLEQAIARAQDVLFGAQGLRAIEARMREHRLRHIIAELGGAAAAQDGGSRVDELAAAARTSSVTLVLTAYRAPSHEVGAKTMDYSRASIRDRWRAGAEDMHRALDTLETGAATSAGHGFTFYDARRAREAGAAASSSAGET